MITQLHHEGFPIAGTCSLLGISRSGYYERHHGLPSRRAQEDQRLGDQVQQIFLHHRRRYGARRIAAELRARGSPCGPRRVARLMKQRGLKALQPKSFRPRTTQSRHRLGFSPHLLAEAEVPPDLNAVWLGDITFVRLQPARFAYLAVLMDWCSRRVVGWALEEQMKEALVLGALRRATAERQPPPGLIHHSDRGGSPNRPLCEPALDRRRCLENKEVTSKAHLQDSTLVKPNRERTSRSSPSQREEKQRT